VARRAPLVLIVLALAGCGSAKHATTSTSVVPECGASEIAIRSGRTGVGLGNYLTELNVVNTGSRRCVIRGVPGRITAVAKSGTRVTLHVKREPTGTYFGRLVAKPTMPGGRVFLDFATSAGCTHPQPASYRDPAIDLPAGGTVTAKGATLTVDCRTLIVSAFGR
jgi:hypothetical protein